MFLHKRNRIWYIWFDDPQTGRRRKVSTHSGIKSDALSALRNFSELTRNKIKAPLLSAFQQQIVDYLLPILAPGTVDIYRNALNHFIIHTGNITIDNISQWHVDSYKSQAMKRLAPTTVNIDLRTLRAAFGIAVRWNLIRENPFTKIKLVPLPETTPSFFSPSEFSQFLKTIHEDWFREIVLCAAMTGLRRSELVNLRWKNVDLKQRVLRIESSKTFRTKTGKKRIVPINPIVFKIFQRNYSSKEEQYVFLFKDAKIDPRLLTHKLKDVLRRAKMDRPGIHYHSLRHTFASWLVQNNVSIYAVKELLGHSDVKITQAYSHLAGSQLHEEVSRLPLLTE